LFLPKYIIYIKKKGEKKRRLDLEILIAAAKKKQKKSFLFCFGRIHA
jgi:predicted ABC-type exoprotein transport system permease subunit